MSLIYPLVISLIISYLITYIFDSNTPTSVQFRESKKNNTPIESKKDKFIKVFKKTTIITYILYFLSQIGFIMEEYFSQ